MTLFTIMISVILVIVGMFWFASFLTLRPTYKYYKETYLALKNKEYLYYNQDNTLITFRPKDKMNGPGFFEEIYFKKNESIKLTSGYIHNDSISILCPYTQYWYWKIKKEMLLHTRSIAEIRQDKLKQLNIK